jgi:hypothetical protein
MSLFSYFFRIMILQFIKIVRLDYKYGRIFCVPGDHIGDRIFLDGLFERSLLETTFDKLLKSQKERFMGSACFDAGANIGNHSLFFSRRFSKVVAFEPNPIFCNAFRATIALNKVENVQLVEKGLGNKKDVVSYTVGDAADLGGHTL